MSLYHQLLERQQQGRPIRVGLIGAGIGIGLAILGLGIGWREEEFAAVGVASNERVRRLTDMIDVLRKAGRGEPTRTLDDGRAITAELYTSLLQDELAAIRAEYGDERYEAGHFPAAAALFLKMFGEPATKVIFAFG